MEIRKYQMYLVVDKSKGQRRFVQDTANGIDLHRGKRTCDLGSRSILSTLDPY